MRLLVYAIRWRLLSTVLARAFKALVCALCSVLPSALSHFSRLWLPHYNPLLAHAGPFHHNLHIPPEPGAYPSYSFYLPAHKRHVGRVAYSVRSPRLSPIAARISLCDATWDLSRNTDCTSLLCGWLILDHRSIDPPPSPRFQLNSQTLRRTARRTFRSTRWPSASTRTQSQSHSTNRAWAMSASSVTAPDRICCAFHRTSLSVLCALLASPTEPGHEVSSLACQ